MVKYINQITVTYEKMIEARGLTCERLHEVLQPFRLFRDGFGHATKQKLLDQAQELGLVGEKIPDPVEPPCSSTQRYIPLRDKTKTVVAWSLIDADDYEQVSKRSWYLFEQNSKRYAASNKAMMHMLIMGQASDGNIIDHIDSDGLNNTRSNLRFASRMLNSQNKVKKAGTSSKYYGVCSSRWGWRAQNAGQTMSYYDTEEKAAFAYDEHVREKYNGQGKINGIEKPDGYEPYKKRQLSCDSRGVSQIGFMFQAGYCVKGTKKYISLGKYDTEKEASEVYEAYRKQIEDEEAAEYLKQEIQRNEDDIAVVAVTVSGVKNAKQTLVDDDEWHFLSKREWHIDSTGYVSALRVRMHSEILKVPKGQVVDHIDNNKLDNRKTNLRASSYAQNGHNKTVTSQSGLKGVYKKRDSFTVSIMFDSKVYRCGTYQDKNVAAYAYDCAAKKLYGTHAKINGVPCPEGFTWNEVSMRLEAVQST